MNKQASLLFMLLEWFFFLASFPFAFWPYKGIFKGTVIKVCDAGKQRVLPALWGDGRLGNLKPPLARIKVSLIGSRRCEYPTRKFVNFSTRRDSKFICVPRGVCLILTLMRRMAWTISARVLGRGTSSQPTNCNGKIVNYCFLLIAQIRNLTN